MSASLGTSLDDFLAILAVGADSRDKDACLLYECCDLFKIVCISDFNGCEVLLGANFSAE